jgi:hypothetical protein
VDLGTRSYRSVRTSWPSGSFQTSHRFGSRACLLLFIIFIVAQPIAEIGPINAPDSLLVALADSFTPLGASLQSIRPDLSRGASVFFSPRRLFLHFSRTPIASAKEGRPFQNSETVNYARLLEPLRGGRSPPSQLN